MHAVQKIPFGHLQQNKGSRNTSTQISNRNRIYYRRIVTSNSQKEAQNISLDARLQKRLKIETIDQKSGFLLGINARKLEYLFYFYVYIHLELILR